MILDPGTFKTSDYRKAIPDWVKVAAAIRLFASKHLLGVDGVLRVTADSEILIEFPVRDLQYDHRPPLNSRPYDTRAGDFIPPQNDPQHIFAVDKADHDERTFGRKAGAEKTVTTRGSDVGEAARAKKIQANDAVHRARLASKAGNYVGAAMILASAKPRKQKFKRKWPSRPFANKRACNPRVDGSK